MLTSDKICFEVEKIVIFPEKLNFPVRCSSSADCILALIISVGQTTIDEKKAAALPAIACPKFETLFLSCFSKAAIVLGDHLIVNNSVVKCIVIRSAILCKVL